MVNYPLRSLMFVPAHNEKLIQGVIRFDADVIVLDLEDSVQPFQMKQVARDNAEKYIKQGLFKNYKVFIRVNDLESGQILKDVHQLTIEGVEGFLCPKVRTGKDVYFFDKLIETIECEKNIAKNSFKIIPIIETTASVLNAQDICKASDRVIAIAFGSEDFITDMHGIHDEEALTLFTARALIVLAARANNVAPIDTACINVHDNEDLERNLILAKKLGFEGMIVLSPKQLPLVHKYFTPSEKEIIEAKEMLKLSEEAEKEAKGVAVMDGKFIGPPLVKRAKNILKKYQTILNKQNYVKNE